MKKRFTEEQIIGFLREAENARLKKLLAEQLFENDLIKDALRKKW
ncbi:IS1404 transposase [Xanthomonas fragariae]|uniref:IS1404 transposase n=1 Tax=Xanthomonas fragariae TaxID=48664 RepID=A0A1Y6HH63_9XANT|nr:IS1404 transposase ORFA [Xanthomonas fragariae LMG 25863]SMR01172.1 hypothetical protein PD885_03958 [Xanthomonas fragariae]SMR05209.1 IS1404 transposase [Xanthomonas fragariae]